MRVLKEDARLAGRYTLIRKLGAGGMSEIWLASDRQTDAPVALKFLSPALSPKTLYRDLLHREWQTGSRLMHAHIVRVFEFHDDDDGAFYSMQNIVGPDASVLAGKDLAQAVRPAALIADALRYAHGKGVVHRDIKASNILIDARGAPYLIDFGVAAEPGTDTSAAGGSRINASPQQLAGEAASPADDMYALGVLLCELITGSPPLQAAPLTMVAADGGVVPPELNLLVNHLLHSDAGKRPDAQSVVDRLRDAGFAPGPAPANLPGTADAARDEVIEQSVQTRRPAERRSQAEMPQPEKSAGVSPTLVYGGLATMLLLFLSVIFLLPRAVDESTDDDSSVDAVVESGDSAVTGSSESADAVDEAALTDAIPETGSDGAGFSENLDGIGATDTARLRAATDEALGDLLSRLERLNARGIDRWGGQSYLDAVDVYEEGDAAYVAKNYATALRQYQRAITMLDPFFDRIDIVFAETMAAARDAFDIGDHNEAVRLYDLAVAITPGNAEAEAGLARALNLEAVMSLTDQGFRYEEDLELDAARLSFEKALALDTAWEPAKVGLERVRAAIARMTFELRMTEGLEALVQGDLPSARAAFNAAKKLDPASSQPADGLLQVELEMRLANIRNLEDRAAQLDAAEQWETSSVVYSDILKIDGDLQFAKDGLARANSMVRLHSQLQGFIDQPDSLSANATMQRATAILLDVSRMPDAGPRITDQKNELSRLLKRAATPLAVQLVSDNATDVAIFKVGKFGQFEMHEINLRPGTYVAVGSRAGYRDVRKEFRVAPEIEMQPIIIQCEEQI